MKTLLILLFSVSLAWASTVEVKDQSEAVVNGQSAGSLKDAMKNLPQYKADMETAVNAKVQAKAEAGDVCSARALHDAAKVQGAAITAETTAKVEAKEAEIIAAEAAKAAAAEAGE